MKRQHIERQPSLRESDVDELHEFSDGDLPDNTLSRTEVMNKITPIVLAMVKATVMIAKIQDALKNIDNEGHDFYIKDLEQSLEAKKVITKQEEEYIKQRDDGALTLEQIIKTDEIVSSKATPEQIIKFVTDFAERFVKDDRNIATIDVEFTQKISPIIEHYITSSTPSTSPTLPATIISTSNEVVKPTAKAAQIAIAQALVATPDAPEATPTTISPRGAGKGSR